MPSSRIFCWQIVGIWLLALSVVGINSQATSDSGSCVLQQDEVCHPKCLLTCTAERDGCPDSSQECTPDVRSSLQQKDRECLHTCMLDCFKANNVEPQCRKDDANPTVSSEEAEAAAKKAAEKAERKRKKKEERARLKKEKELANPCGSCYGAEDHSPLGNGCCGTCDEVRRAYEAKRWTWPGNEAVLQCKGQPDTPAQPPPPPSPAVCAAKLSCQDCFLSGCAWCIAGRRCVEDKPWMCQGETDHIGRIGAVKSCPSHEERKTKRARRKADEDEAKAERLAEESARLLTGSQAGGGAEGAGMDEARARARAKLESRQQEELERVRREEGLGGGGGAGAGEGAGEGEGAEGGGAGGGRKVDPAVREEIERRAAKAGEGTKQPYEVLGVETEAQMNAIRKAYRRLSLLLHPDKVSDPKLRELAQVAFMDVVAAYEILGDPDKRAAFDDMGGSEQAQFSTFWEWTTFGKGEATDFYTGEKLITRLTEKLWPRRVSGDSVWLVEFYAPWCSACGTFVQDYKKIARLLEADEIEVGAINCEKNKLICSEWFSISSYPTLMMVGSAERGTQQLYPKNKGKSPDEVVEWARQVASEWRYLYSKAHIELFKSEANFTQDVLHSELLWFVVFTDGVHCGPCRTAMTNALRLASGLMGVAKVGVVDCEEPDTHDLCYETLALPPPPHAPQIRIFRAGKKDPESAPKYAGELLYNANEVQPHVALQLVELVARNALHDKIAANALAAGQGGDYADDEEKKDAPPPDPPRPPPMWNGPSEEDLPRGISWGHSGRSMGFHNAIGA